MLYSRLTRFLMVCCNYSCLVLGITSRIYNFEQGLVVGRTWQSVYATVMNFLFLAGAPFAIRAGYRISQSENSNQLVAFTDMVNMVLHFSVLLLTIAARWRRDKRFYAIALEVFSLDEQYFNKLPLYPSIMRHFDRVFFLKCVLTTLQGTVMYFGSMRMLGRTVSIEFLLLTMYATMVQSMLLGVLMYYFLALLHLRKRLTLINEELIKLHASLLQLFTDSKFILGTRSFTLQQLCRVAAADLKKMCQVHQRLTQLVIELNDVFKCQAMAVLLVSLSKNITFGYYAVLLLDGSSELSTNLMGNVTGGISVIVLFSDLSLFYHVCEATTLEYQRTGEILKEFSNFPVMEKAFERQLEIFCLQLMHHKLNINMAGMFNLNKEAALAMWSFTLRHTLILVQSEIQYGFSNWKQKVALEIQAANDLV